MAASERVRPGAEVAAICTVTMATFVMGCGSASDADGAPDDSGARHDAADGSTIIEHRVLPSATDPAIGAPDRESYAYVSADAHAHGLFLFLAGTAQEPAQSTLVLKEAARAGYHVVAVDYDNANAVIELCVDDVDCYSTVRQEMLDGTDVSALIAVDPANSILARTVRLIQYLAEENADEGWGKFVLGGTLVYERVVASGHSQGGGHAAFLAKLHVVMRVVMFSSVVDTAPGPPPVLALWVSSEHATPTDRFYGFEHTADPYAPAIEVAWAALGIDGAPASVDDAVPPYGGAHALSTSLVAESPHNAIVLDEFTPMVEGVPTYRDAWRHLIGP